MIGNIKGRLKGKNKVKVGEIHNEEDALDLQFEEAAVWRDRIRDIKENLLFGAE